MSKYTERAQPPTNLARMMTCYRTMNGLGFRKMARMLNINFATLDRFERGMSTHGDTVIPILKWALEASDDRKSEGKPDHEPAE